MKTSFNGCARHMILLTVVMLHWTHCIGIGLILGASVCVRERERNWKRKHLCSVCIQGFVVVRLWLYEIFVPKSYVSSLVQCLNEQFVTKSMNLLLDEITAEFKSVFLLEKKYISLSNTIDWLANGKFQPYSHMFNLLKFRSIR